MLGVFTMVSLIDEAYKIADKNNVILKGNIKVKTIRFSGYNLSYSLLILG